MEAQSEASLPIGRCSMRYGTIKYKKKGPISVLTLNRPEASNAVNPQMATELKGLAQEIRDDDDVRVVILTGAGEAFSIGTELDIPHPDGLRDSLDRQRVAGELSRLECPVIAAINGDALGQGLELALACDIRLASESASMGLDQIRYGLLPWDGGTQRLPRAVGRG
ncbi:MAG: enoyl-CoA hydratase/isomerase family protein, partial [Dehalococcoidia bacterium]